MNKKPALIAAFLTTALVAMAMLMIGMNAYFNPDSVPVASAAATGANVEVAQAASSEQVAQLQALVAQYQAREQQYQAREQQYQSQLSQANAQLQQDNQILAYLQQQRIITIDRNGQISIARGRNN